MKTEVQLFRVRGMDCADEVAVLRRVLDGVVPSEQLGFDLLQGVMAVPGSVNAAAVVAAVAGTGMVAEPIVAGVRAAGPTPWQRHSRTVFTALSGVAVVLGFALHAALSGVRAATGSEGLGIGTDAAVPVVVMGVYGVAVVTGLVMVLPKALFSLRTLRPDMNLLMTLAVAGAIGLGEWFEAATVSFLFALSLALEAWSVGRARRAVEALLSLSPPQVRIKREAGTEEVPVGTVPIGTVFVVRPGERFGLDGIVVQGRSDVDQAPITGESIPVAKEPSDEVYAGTINGNGALEVRSTKSASDTTLAQVVRMVGEARRDRSDSEQWVERFARIYTPVVFGTAFAVLVVPPLVFGGSFEVWLYRALVLLVIGCPCALVIATPVSVVSGLAAAARHGVLVKGGRFLEVPARIRVVAVDKTGTLTQGRPVVVSVEPMGEHTRDKLLANAAAIELNSEHPVARAIVQRARQDGLVLPSAHEVVIVPGKGTSGRVGALAYWLGSHRWLEDRGQEVPDLHELLEERSRAGRTVVVVGTDDHVCGFITLADAVREDAARSVADLHAAGIARVVMLTGDNHGTAAAVAAVVGIDEVHAQLLPSDKVAVVAALEARWGPVAMVGDGVNDAPALARASLGVAMGAMGTDVAIETADIALMTDDLSKLAWLVRHSKWTLSIIRQNTVFALSIKAVFVVLTFAGFASLWGAIAADMGASVLVVFNALRLLGGARGR